MSIKTERDLDRSIQEKERLEKELRYQTRDFYRASSPSFVPEVPNEDDEARQVQHSYQFLYLLKTFH